MFADILTGNAYLVRRIEDQPDGTLRVYVGRGVYFVPDAADNDNIRREWANTRTHLFVSKRDVPADALCYEEPHVG